MDRSQALGAAEDVVVVVVTHPAEGARELARALVERRLAACVQVSAPVESCYRWEGAVETASEARLEIKTVRARLDALQRFLRERHPYEVPEILVLPVVGGHAAYLDWVREAVGEP